MENDDVLGVVALRLELGHGTGRAESDISGSLMCGNRCREKATTLASPEIEEGIG
jgi:hypothetical protein